MRWLRNIIQLIQLRNAETDFAAFRKFHRIAQEIQQHLAEAGFIHPHHVRQRRKRFIPKGQPFPLRPLPDNLGHVVEKRRQNDLGCAQFGSAGLDFAKV